MWFLVCASLCVLVWEYVHVAMDVVAVDKVCAAMVANMSCFSNWLETSRAWDALRVCVYDVVVRDKDM